MMVRSDCEWQDMLDEWKKSNAIKNAEIDRLRAEVAELREVLDGLLNAVPMLLPDWEEKARAILAKHKHEP